VKESDVTNATRFGATDASGYYRHPLVVDQRNAPCVSRTQALASLPPVVYFMRMPDGIIKIGHSGDMAHRMSVLGGELLAFTPGDRTDERAHHKRFAHCLDHGREWFRPEPDLITYVNDLRAGLGLPEAA
jgi:hypothetical protein